MADELTTKPTLDTLLERINAVFEQGLVNQREIRSFRATVEQRFEVIETSLDRIESLANQTRAEMLAMRADFRELRSEFNGLRSQLTGSA
jgi:chromosome segregation ATPase